MAFSKYSTDGRRRITPDAPLLAENELSSLEASDLLIYEKSDYQYQQEMRIKWEFFYNDVSGMLQGEGTEK